MIHYQTDGPEHSSTPYTPLFTDGPLNTGDLKEFPSVSTSIHASFFLTTTTKKHTNNVNSVHESTAKC